MATDRDQPPEPMPFFQRVHYTLASGIAVTMVLMLASAVISVFAPQLELIPFFLSPHVYWLLVPIYVAAWTAAPHLSRKYPIAPWWRG
jgi:hypothetical protein